MNLQNIPLRLGASLVIVIGIAGVVSVLTAILSMHEGFQATLNKAGFEDRAIALRNGASSELTSDMSREQVDVIKGAPGIKRGDNGQPIAAAELMVIVDLKKIDSDDFANAAVRGVQRASFAVRPEVKLKSGRLFTPGTRELVVGSEAQKQFSGLDVGSRIAFRDADWTIVGVFAAAGGASESELWGDAEALLSAYRRNSFQSVSVVLEQVSSFAVFKDVLSADPGLQLKVLTLKQYFAAQSESLGNLIKVLGYLVGSIMAIGAVFGALNTMYAAVSTRAREIATMRAIGFGAAPVVTSVLVEAMVLAALGGALGGGAAYLIFNGYTAATLGANFSQVAFDFRVTPELLMRGMMWALVIGLVGGLLPAWHSLRTSITMALRRA